MRFPFLQRLQNRVQNQPQRRDNRPQPMQGATDASSGVDSPYDFGRRAFRPSSEGTEANEQRSSLSSPVWSPGVLFWLLMVMFAAFWLAGVVCVVRHW